VVDLLSRDGIGEKEIIISLSSFEIKGLRYANYLGLPPQY
jgi:hypothetical protein